MSSHKLHNYLRTYRKRSGLSQRELAFLLGCRSGAKVSRYERLARQPGLRTVFAYVAIFGVPPQELFAGFFDEVKGKTFERARLLMDKLCAAKPHPLITRKLDVLKAMYRCERSQTDASRDLLA